MTNLHGAIRKQDSKLEHVCNKLSTLEDYNYKEYAFNVYECESGEALEASKSAEVTPDIHTTGSENVLRFSELSRSFKFQ